MSRERVILHADADAFFASVEQRDDPALRDRPVLVGTGVVMACSYEAKACGVHGGMSGGRARRLCPRAVAVPPRFEAYVEASKKLFAVFRDSAPVVEGLSMEEAFLDVGGLPSSFGSPREIGARLRARVREEVGLPVTVGVARTKIVAKMASRAAKPDGLLEVPPGGERAFLDPLPVEALWGVGESTARKLHDYGLLLVRDLARCSEAELMSILGKGSGRHVHALAHNRDRVRVRTNRRRRSVGSQHAFGRTPKSPHELDGIVVALVDRVTRRMRSSHYAGRTVILRLRFRDYSRASRSHTLTRATAASEAILAAARTLFAAAAPLVEHEGLTMVGVAVTNLEDTSQGSQLTLPDADSDAAALDSTLDEVRDRFGPETVKRAAQLGRDLRLSPWVPS